MRILKKVKEIRSRAGVLHFERFAILQTKWASLYLHRIHKADQDPHLHSHPWNFVTMILRGTYIARGPDGLSTKSPGTLSRMDRNGFHKIEEIVDGPVTTLFFAHGEHRPWYYWVNEHRIDFRHYREMKAAGTL